MGHTEAGHDLPPGASSHHGQRSQTPKRKPTFEQAGSMPRVGVWSWSWKERLNQSVSRINTASGFQGRLLLGPCRGGETARLHLLLVCYGWTRLRGSESLQAGVTLRLLLQHGSQGKLCPPSDPQFLLQQDRDNSIIVQACCKMRQQSMG